MNVNEMSSVEIGQCYSKLFNTYYNSVVSKFSNCEDRSIREEYVKEYEVIVSKLQLLAQKGDAKAQFRLGMHYQTGIGIDKDLDNAEHFYLKAASQGYAEAQCELGNLYKRGIYKTETGNVKNIPEAFKWLKKAAENGYCEAQESLSTMYSFGDLPSGIEKNEYEAFKWALKAAEQCNLTSMSAVAARYRDGRGVKANVAKALEWYVRSAEAGWTESKIELGDMFYEGKCVPQDFRQAFKWYMVVAENPNNKDGYADYSAGKAMYKIGIMYADGKGVFEDFIEASKWLSKAHDNGISKAYDRLSNLNQKGVGGFLKKIFG